MVGACKRQRPVAIFINLNSSLSPKYYSLFSNWFQLSAVVQHSHFSYNFYQTAFQRKTLTNVVGLSKIENAIEKNTTWKIIKRGRVQKIWLKRSGNFVIFICGAELIYVKVSKLLVLETIVKLRCTADGEISPCIHVETVKLIEEGKIMIQGFRTYLVGSQIVTTLHLSPSPFRSFCTRK